MVDEKENQDVIQNENTNENTNQNENHMVTNSKSRKILNIITNTLLAMVVLLAMLLVGVRFMGFEVYTVLSGSMEPTYHVGALVYVKDVDATEIEIDDVITFMVGEDTVATHRVIDVVPDETDSSILRFETKGYANDVADAGLVHQNNVIGKVAFSIPYLGFVADFISHPPGNYMAIAFGAILLILVFLPEIIWGKK